MPAAVKVSASFLILSSPAFARYSSVGSSPPVIEAAFSDLPEDTRVNPLDRILDGGSH
jgi:hypothetical protein